MNDGLSLVMEVVDALLSRSTGQRRETLEGYYQKLAELLQAAQSDLSK